MIKGFLCLNADSIGNTYKKLIHKWISLINF